MNLSTQYPNYSTSNYNNSSLTTTSATAELQFKPLTVSQSTTTI
jgi:hypothetical protein